MSARSRRRAALISAAPVAPVTITIPDNYALSFDGVNDYGLAARATTMEPAGDFTAAVKFRFDGTYNATRYPIIFSNHGTTFHWLIGAHEFGDNRIFGQINVAGVPYNIPTVALAPQTGFVHNAALYRTGSDLYLRVDGTSYGPIAASASAITDATMAPRIGNYSNGTDPDGAFDGIITKAAYWNSFIGTANIDAWFAADDVTIHSPTHAWKVVSSSANVLEDNIGAVDFTMNGSALVKKHVQAIEVDFFGHHLGAPTLNSIWPSVPFKTFRTWDSFPGVAWTDIHTAAATYNWTDLDALITEIETHAGTDIVYTFGIPPGWVIDVDGADWTAFVTAITARYGARIKYYELWNEPNAANFWAGTTAELVTMAAAAYPIIKAAGGTVLSPAPQGSSSPTWLNTYFTAGGDAYCDVVAFHGYMPDPPEDQITTIAAIRAVMVTHGISHLPLWDTEHSWGNNTDPAAWPFGVSDALRIAWLGRHMTINAAGNIKRSIWYMWDSFEFGRLFDRTPEVIFPTGTAYGVIQNWLTGNSVDPMVISGAIHVCKITRPNDSTALIAWATSGSPRLATVETTFQRMDGTTVAVSGGSVTLGAQPIIIPTPPSPFSADFSSDFGAG